MRSVHRAIRFRVTAAALALGAGVYAGAALAAESTSLPSLSPRVSAFFAAVRASGGPFLDLDGAAASADVKPRLMLPELASRFAGPLGIVVHVPAHVSRREGGRVSLFELSPGASATLGVYTVAGQLYDRKVTRKTGTGQIGVGDRIEEQIVDTHGQTVQTLNYQVTAIDRSSGAASFSNLKSRGFEDGDIVNDDEGWCWSCNGASSWWCGFPCFPGGGGGDIPTTAVVCAM